MQSKKVPYVIKNGIKTYNSERTLIMSIIEDSESETYEIPPFDSDNEMPLYNEDEIGEDNE